MPHRAFSAILILFNLFFTFTAPASAQEVLTWPDCLAEAKKNHPDLISAVESVNQEKAAQDVAASALFPRTGADLDIFRAKTGITTANTYSYGVNGTQLIFDGMKTSSEIKAASENVKAAEANFAGASFELARAKRSVEFVQRQLTKEMGRKEFVPVAVAGDFTVRETAVEKPDFDALVKNNPSVLNALAQKNAASFGVRSARANFSPTVSGSAGAEKS